MEVDSDASDQDVVKLALEGSPEGGLRVQLKVEDGQAAPQGVKKEEPSPEAPAYVPGTCSLHLREFAALGTAWTAPLNAGHH